MKNFNMFQNEWFDTKNNDISLLKQYSERALLTYAAMIRNLTIRNTIIFNISELYQILNIDKNDKVKRTYVKDSIQQMNNNIFTIYQDSKCSLSVNPDELDSKKNYYALLSFEIKDNYFAITDDEIDRIIKVSNQNGIHYGKLFAQYAYIHKCFNGDQTDKTYNTCYCSIANISKNTM
jgi:hypothetical protein